MPFWDRTIDVVILSHPHQDHMEGLIAVFKRYKVMHYYTENVKNLTPSYKRLQDVLATKKMTANFMFSGDRITFADKTSLLTLWPDKSLFDSHILQDIENTETDNISLDDNGYSVIELLSYGNFKALLTGDAGFLVGDKIAANAGVVDVLKVPHHGSKTGMSRYFLSEINPNLAVISVGAANKYGHPSSEAINLLAGNGVKTLRTDKDGEVEIISDGMGFFVL